MLCRGPPTPANAATPQGFFIPVYHKAYWMGLKLNGSWPNFAWRDPYVRRGYNQWSLAPPAPSTSTADVTAGYAPGYGTPIAYGWVDEVGNATKKIAFCRTVSTWPCCPYPSRLAGPCHVPSVGQCVGSVTLWC